mgnify:CR=1 FL=1
MKRIVQLLIITLLCSCGRVEQKQIDNIVILTEEALPPLKEFYSVRVRYPNEDMFNMPDAYVYRDTIILISDRMAEDTIVTVCSINRDKIYGRYYKKGVGPNEMTRARIEVRGGFLNGYDSNLRAVFRMSIDSIISKGNNYFVTPIRVNSWEGLTSNDFYNDSTILAVDPWYIRDGKLEQGLNQFYKIDLKSGERVIPFEYDNDMIFTSNLTSGPVLCYDGGFVFAHGHRPIVSFYDDNLSLLKSYVGPEPDDLEYDIKKDALSRSLWYKEGFYYYAMSICESENYIFVRKYRVHNKSNDEIRFIGSEAEIWQFEKSTMNFVARYHPNVNHEILTLSYSEATNTFYFTVAKDEFELHKSVWEEPAYEEEEE